MKKYAFLYCSDPLDNRKVDFDYNNEFNEVRKLGYETALFSYEDLVYFNKIPNLTIKNENLIYRGWMLKEKEYSHLYESLLKQGYKLINSSEEYINCHHLINWYEELKEYTPKSIVIKLKDLNDNSIKSALSDFGDKSVIVKDYVKSRKHEWLDSFYIPNSIDFNNSVKVVKNFINRQGEDLVGGVALREFIQLEQIGNHNTSNMPIANEVRIFIINRNVVAAINYWNGNSVEIENLEIEEILQKVNSIESNFYTVDIAKNLKGEWIIIEVGDGQVSGLQEYNEQEFYLNIDNILSENY